MCELKPCNGRFGGNFFKSRVDALLYPNMMTQNPDAPGDGVAAPYALVFG
jgi:hypothetical protein